MNNMTSIGAACLKCHKYGKSIVLSRQTLKVCKQKYFPEITIASNSHADPHSLHPLPHTQKAIDVASLLSQRIFSERSPFLEGPSFSLLSCQDGCCCHEYVYARPNIIGNERKRGRKQSHKGSRGQQPKVGI